MSEIIDKQLGKLPSEVKFCKRCVVSNQRPRIHFDENGLCGACNYTDYKNNVIDWEKRGRELQALCDKFRSRKGAFDCIVPSSGGKDSALVAHKLKYLYGMNPLVVTYAPFEYTDIGYQNFRSFCKAGFTVLEAWPNDKLHSKLARFCFETMGDAWQPFAFGQMAYAFHIARKFDIKLVFFGENGEAEYSGDPEVFDLPGMPYEMWAEKYYKGVTIDTLMEQALDQSYYITKDLYRESDLMFYKPPPVSEMVKHKIQFHWYGYYEKWLPQGNYYYAAEHTGFRANPERSEGTYSKYASLDDRMDGFHFYMAYIKFGIGRATADASHEIRDGHIERNEGVALVKRYDGEFPKKYYDEFLNYLGISKDQFWQIVNKYRRPEIWNKTEDGWELKHKVWDESS